MEQEYRPEKIPHVKGQDKKIESREKAHDMALQYENFSDIIKHYRNYLKLNPEEKTKVGNEFFKEMDSREISPEYIEAIADHTAESVGARHDLTSEALDKSTEELKKDVRDVVDELRKYSNHPYIEVKNLPDGQTSIQSKFPEKIRELVLDADAVEEQRLRRFLEKMQIAHTELERRQKFGLEPGKY